MARIRSVHPELFTDEAFCALSPHARLLYIGIWTLCDDAGVFEWKPFGMKINVLPCDAVDVPALLNELVAQNQIKQFEVDGKAYGAVRNFCLYQRPKRPTYKHPMAAWATTYTALNRREAEAVTDKADTSSPPLTPTSPTSGGKRPHRRVEEGREGKGENPKTDSEPVVVVVPPAKAEATTTTTEAKKGLAGKQGGLGALLGRPLPTDWVPSDETCAKVFSDFGMTEADINAELPAFHALNVSQGTLSQDWGGTFYLFAKRWKERLARGARRVELSKAPTSTVPFEPTEKDWESTVKIYASTGRWSHQFGPDPMSGKCRCPKDILERHSIDPATGEVRRKATVGA